MSEETIFNRILKGDVPCDEVYSDEQCLAFRDVNPQAPVHILIIPRKAIKSLLEVKTRDAEILGHLLLVAGKVARKEGLESWRTVINIGESSGQTVFHLHLHIIGGRKLSWPPG